MSDIRNLVNQMVSRYMGNSAQRPLTLPAVNDLSVGADEYARKHKPATGQLGLFEKPEERQKPLFSKKVDDEAGRWITMRGARVFISGDDGRVLKGPKRLMGKTKEMIERESAGKGEGAEKPPMPKGLAEMGRIRGGRKDNRQKGLFEEINPGFKWDEDEDVKSVSPKPSAVQLTRDEWDQKVRDEIRSIMGDADYENTDIDRRDGVDAIDDAFGFAHDNNRNYGDKIWALNDKWIDSMPEKEIKRSPAGKSEEADGEPFALSGAPSKSPVTPTDFGKADGATKQGALFDSGKGKGKDGKGDLPGQELLFNSDAGDLGNPKTMENRVGTPDPSESELEDFGLFREFGGRYQYKLGDKSRWLYSNSKEGALEEARKYYAKNRDSLRTSQQRFDDANQNEYENSHSRWGHLSDDQIQKMIERDSAAADSLRSNREFTGQGTRRSGPAMANQGARESMDTVMQMQRYLDARKAKSGKELTKDDSSPQEGDVGATGLVFRNGRWHRDDEEETASADSSISPAVDEPKLTDDQKANLKKQFDDYASGKTDEMPVSGSSEEQEKQKKILAAARKLRAKQNGSRSTSPAVDEPKSLEVKSELEPQKPTSTYSGSFNPETHGDYKAFMDLKKKINAGELTVDEFKQAHKFYVDNKDAFTADLAKRYDAKTLRNIAGNLGDWRAIRGENKKGENADSVYSSMMQHAFDIGKGISNVYSGDEAREGLSKAALRRLADHVEKQTAESLAEHIAESASAIAEREAANKANEEAAANPKTLRDFELAMRSAGGYDKLKPEQQALYDELMSEKTRSGREEEKRPTVVEAKVSGDHGGFELTKNFHSKRGQDIFTASPKNRVDRDEYDKMNTAAKRLGGWYYKQFGSTPGGFHFPDEEKRNKFLQAMAGESVDRSDILAEKDQSKGEAKAEKLSDLADRMSERAKESLGRDRKDNTARRARMADSAIAAAEHELNQSARLKSIAEAIEAGEAKHLKGLNSLTQLEALQRVWRQHQRQYEEHKLKEKYGDNWNRDASYSEREKTYQNPVSVESASFVKMPRQIIYPSNVSKFLEQAANTPGLKQEAAKWQKAFKATGPDSNDRGITLNKRSTEEWYEFANRAKSKGVKHDWSGFTSKDDFQRLASMGIREDHELRAAIRELAKHQNVKHGSAPVKDPVREFEKKIHREHKEAGFYPTPPKVVDRLMDLADIKDNHDVLEPSAGSGRIMDAIKAAHGDSVKLKGVEHHSTLNELLKMKGHDIDHGDFLEHKGSYDRIVMNPPFENDQAVDHVKHALSLLKPGGRIVAVIPGNERTYRDASRNKRKEFAALVDQHGGHFEELPEGSFKGSDVDRETGVNTSIVVLHKPGTEKYSRLQMYEIARDVADKYVRESVEVVPVDRYAHPLIHAAVGGLGHMAVQSLVKNTTLRRIAHAAVASAMAAWMASANAQNPSSSPAGNQTPVNVSAPASPFMRQKAGNRSIDNIVNQAFQNHQKNVAAVKAGQAPSASPVQSLASSAVPHSISNTTGARAPGVKPLKGEDEPKSANPSTLPAGNGDTSGKSEGFTDSEHPRHPAGAPESKGGEFAPKGEGSTSGEPAGTGENEGGSRNYPDNLNKPADQQTNYSPPEGSIESLAGGGEPAEPQKSLADKIAEHRMKLASQKTAPEPKSSRRDNPNSSWKSAMSGATERLEQQKAAKQQARKQATQQKKAAQQQEQATSFNPAELSQSDSDSNLISGEDSSPFDDKPKPDDFKREKDYQRALKAWNREKGAKKASVSKKIAKSVVPSIALEYELSEDELSSAVNDAIAMESEGLKRQEDARKYVVARGYNAGRINKNEDSGTDHSSTALDEFASEWAGLFPEVAGSDESQWVDKMWNLAKAGPVEAPSSGDEDFVRKVAERLHESRGQNSSPFPDDSESGSFAPIHGQIGDVDFTPFSRRSLVDSLNLIVDRYLRETIDNRYHVT